jgi:hypothetical protein
MTRPDGGRPTPCRRRLLLPAVLTLALVLGGCCIPCSPWVGTSAAPSPPPMGSSTVMSPQPTGSPPPTGVRWTPAPGVMWQLQLTTPVDTGVAAQVFDIDGVENDATVVATLRAAGHRVICYVDTGAAEDFRSDYQSFPSTLLGKSDGFPGERWLDIRQLDVLRPIMALRFDLCRAKGFDAIDADEADGYANDTGFPLTAADQLNYNRMLATLAHERGLSIGLKNDLAQISDLVTDFDFAINEQCVEYNECDALTLFVRAGKAVFHVEYNLDTTQFCAKTTGLAFSSIRKNIALDAARWPC